MTIANALSWALTGHAPEARPAPPTRAPMEIPALRGWIGPLALLTTTPFLVVVLWMIAAHFDGSIARFVTTIDPSTFVALIPRPTPTAIGIVTGWIVLQAVLLVGLPGPMQLGPITPTGRQPAYRGNGLLAWVITHALVIGGWAAGLFSASTVIRELGSIIVVLNAFALALCVLLYWKGRHHPSSTDAVHTGHVLFDFFQGIELHPTLFGVQLKQLLNCRVSMMGWSVLVLCLAGHQIETYGYLSIGMAVSTALLALYLLKFFVWEGGYFSSLDIMHDRFGYYICWGVLVWVPSVYTIFAQVLAHRPSDLHPAAAIAIFLLGLGSLWANFDADAQRQRVRATGGRTMVWGREPRTILARYRTSDGAERTNLLLVSGYWGIARHFHYVPELAMALAWALPAGPTRALPYFYFAFLVILLVDRAARDDARCRAKYGPAWEEYCRLVPAKILPGIY